LQGGAIYTGSDIDELMAHPPASMRKDVFHGTAVSSIAAGRGTGNGLRHFPGGVAPRARIIAIRHETGGTSIGYSVGHINALSLIDRRATDLGLPVVVNISNGMNAGAHNGTADVELKCTAFTETSQKAGRIVVKSAGNERNSGRHAQFTVTGANRLLRLNSRSKPGKDGVKAASERLELWFGTHNVYEFAVQTPDRTQWYAIPVGTMVNEKLDTRNSLCAFYRQYASEPTKMSKLEIEILPGDKDAVQSGEWSLRMRPIKFRDTDEVHAWLELHDTRDVRFMDYVDLGYTITVPGTSADVITVAAAAADGGGLIYADGSKGPALGGVVKPDLIAPGVSIAAAQAGTQMEVMAKGESGTSFAAPHVTGAIALALSAFQKKPPREPGRKVNQSFIRILLLDSSRNYRYRGNAEAGYEAGYGDLDAAAFFDAVRAAQ
jgi:subtilisin family serine protease